MEWDRKKSGSPGGMREIGIILLAVGIAFLGTGIVLAVTFGTVLVPILLGGSVFVNTAAVVCLRHSKTRSTKGGRK